MADLFTERTPIVGAAGEEVPLTEESKAKIIRLVFRVLVTVMVTVNTSLCFFRGAQYSNKYGVSYGVKYFLLGCSLIGFNALLNIMFGLWRRGDIPRSGQKFLYCFGGVITLQSILADIAAMSNCI